MLDLFTHAESLSTDPSIARRREWPEAVIYRYDRNGHEIVRIVKGVDDKLIASVTTEPIELALIISEPLLIIGSKVGDAMPWAGASFHWHRISRPDRILPSPGADTSLGSKINLKLQEAPGGLVRATRSLTLPIDFTRMLHDAILDQARYTYDPVEERRAMTALLRRRPTPSALVAHASARAQVID